MDLQKRWVQRIWTEAAAEAARAGEAAVSPQRLRERIEQWCEWSEAPGGQIEVRFINHPPLTVSKLRAEQYGSIAYSLRAILSVQQDRIISRGDSLLTLAPGSIEVLRESTDTVTLSALMIAGQSLRELNEFEITGAGHELVGAIDASRAVQRLIPHEIDDFEDVRNFPRLALTDQNTLAAYDCDSFRDFGLHWPPLERAIRMLPKEARLPDPFAAEILAEAISQYGVLLLRVAGDIAKQSADTVRLQPERCGPEIGSGTRSA